MTEDTIPAAPETPASTISPEITALEIDANSVRHDGEVAVHHELKHLEDEFVKYVGEAWAITEADAKEVLTWIAAKI